MITALKRKLRRFSALPLADKLLLPPIVLLLGLSRAAMLYIPFRVYSKTLGCYCKTRLFTPTLSAAQITRARQLQFLVQGMANLTPWESKCLAQAMTTSVLFNREKLPYVLHFGLAKNTNPEEDKPMNAHAWLTAGPVYVTGGRSLHQFAVVATYAAPSLKTAVAGLES